MQRNMFCHLSLPFEMTAKNESPRLCVSAVNRLMFLI